jgi:hypothetical protein
MPLTIINFDLSCENPIWRAKRPTKYRKIEFDVKKLTKVNHLRKHNHCSQPAAPFSFGPYPQMAKENPLVSASSEALR